jgi:phosphopantetheinyl transferase (holo-ACP synthase)
MDTADVQQIAGELAFTVLDHYGCSAYNIELAQCGAWGNRDERAMPLSQGETIRLYHDERGAPYAVHSQDEENTRIIVSYSDEEDLAAWVWACTPSESQVAGIGIDLAKMRDTDEERSNRFARLLLSEHEREIVASVYPDDLSARKAYALSAKEASFKACAAPLREWMNSGKTSFAYDAMEYELIDATHTRGTLRRGRAQVAMDAMGIRMIELSHVRLYETVLTLAVALR